MFANHRKTYHPCLLIVVIDMHVQQGHFNSLICDFYFLVLSAGISRDWVGVPRKMFKPGKRDHKCVCIKTTGSSSDTGQGNEGDLNHPNMKQYPNCGKYDVSCKA